jgi:hypothetical protein
VTSFNARTDCSYDVHSGWTCIEFLSSNQDAKSILHWSASGGITGTTFSPQNGTIEPGIRARVSIFVPNTICPTDSTIIFTGMINRVAVPWRCVAPMLIAAPSSLGSYEGCSSYPRIGGWICHVTLGSSEDSQGILKWSATVEINNNSISGTQFQPSSGMLYPDQPPVVVDIIFNVNSCNQGSTATFIFSGSSTASVSWSCQ